MSESFSPYPLLGNEHYMTIGYASDCPSFSYMENFEEFPLQLESTGGTFRTIMERSAIHVALGIHQHMD